MIPLGPGKSGASGYQGHVDYRPSRCRCGAAVQPHELVCHNCGRQQNLLLLGLDRLYEDDLPGAIAWHEGKVRENPDDHSRIHQLAGVKLLNGEYDAARELYRRAISLNPDIPEAHLNLGVIQAVLGDDDEAVKEFKEFIKLDLHSPRVERVLRAVCAIKNIPYEDALYETGVRPAVVGRKAKLQSTARRKIGTDMSGGTLYSPVTSVEAKPRTWGAIDTFLLLIACCAILAWFFLPLQTKDLINKTIASLQNRYTFTVTSDHVVAMPENEEEESEEDEGPAIINADTESRSYLPLATDNRWEYMSYDSRNPLGTGNRENESIVEVRVLGMESIAQNIWRVRNGSNTFYYVEKNTGLYSIINPDHPWSTQIIQVPYPPDDGVTRTDLDQTVTVIGTEIVETSLGLIECVKLKYTLPEPSGTTWYAWYGRGIGLVKYIGGGRDGTYHVRVLRSFELQ